MPPLTEVYLGKTRWYNETNEDSDRFSLYKRATIHRKYLTSVILKTVTVSSRFIGNSAAKPDIIW